ncbi:MAG: hypothetical protein H7263_18945 [Candidatus Sericytochromatia bacterium]|nr:hypothetical protein [Candidatus Sericytochromatia bacterium]
MMIKQIKVAYLIVPLILLSCGTGNNLKVKADGNTLYINEKVKDPQIWYAKSEKSFDLILVSKPDTNIDPNTLVSKPDTNIDPNTLVSKPDTNIDPNTLVSKPGSNIDPNTLVSKPGSNIDPNKLNVDNGSADILFAQGNSNLNIKINLLEFSISSLSDPLAASDSLDINLSVDDKYDNFTVHKENFKGKGSFMLNLKGLKSSNKVNLYVSTKDINGNKLLEKQVYQDNINGNKSIDIKLSKVLVNSKVQPDNTVTPSPTPTVIPSVPDNSATKTNNLLTPNSKSSDVVKNKLF